MQIQQPTSAPTRHPVKRAAQRADIWVTVFLIIGTSLILLGGLMALSSYISDLSRHLH